MRLRSGIEVYSGDALIHLNHETTRQPTINLLEKSDKVQLEDKKVKDVSVNKADEHSNHNNSTCRRTYDMSPRAHNSITENSSITKANNSNLNNETQETVTMAATPEVHSVSSSNRLDQHMR